MLKSPQNKFASVLLAFWFASRMVGSAEGMASPSWLDRTWETDDGLPDNNVTGVAQSPDGYLWVATFSGLVCFNGTRFEEFSLAHLPNVPNRIVRKIFLDHRGRLWLFMDRGVIIRVSRDAARVFTTADGLPDARTLAMAEDGDGAMWLAMGNLFYRLQDDKVTPVGAAEDWPGGPPWLTADRSGKIWFGRGTHLGVLENGNWKNILTLESAPLRLIGDHTGGFWICTATEILHYQPGGKLERCAPLPEKIIVSAMVERSDGALWLGTETDGLFRLQAGVLEHIPTSHPEISSLTEDREGNLWVGTGGGGLNLLRAQAMHLVGKKDGLPGEAVRSVCQDTTGELWAAMSNGALVHGHDDQWTAVTAADGWPGGNATCVAAARGGGLWIGTRDRGLQFFQAGKWTEWSRDQALGGAWVRSLLVSSSGDLWIATVSPNQLVRFRNGKFETLAMPGEVRSLRALAEGADGTIWVGSSDGHLFRVRDLSVTGETLTRESRPLSIRALHTTSDGSLWIGYAGWGIGWLRDGHYTRITTRDGLYDDYISQILADGNGNLWLTSNHGLFQVRQKDLAAVAEDNRQRVRPVVYGKNEGLPGIQPSWDNGPSVCRATNGQLWFATHNGLLAVEPAAVQSDAPAPPVMLERVAVDDVTVAVRDARSPLRGPEFANCLDLSARGEILPLAPGRRKIEFYFTALNFRSPENVHLRYRLKNFDNAWIEADAQRAAKYPQLPPGDYEFQVQACSDAGIWNEPGARLKLSVAPFFWQTWWFRSVALVLFSGSLIGLVRYFSFRRLRWELDQLARQAELQRERTRIARDMHDEVGTKLSRLTLLSELASQQPAMPAAARGDVAEISETARDAIRSFEQIVWAVNPKNDTLANLANYLCRFAEELFDGSPIQCAFNLPDKIPETMMSTEMRHHVFLAAKEALNNALKHSRATRVCVRLALTADSFEIGIEDDGRGFAKDAPLRPGSGNGLENMPARMKAVGGQFEIQSRPGAGTRVILRVPLPREKAG